MLNLLEEEYPDVYRFVTAVYPSADDDVITSPYNSVLAMRELTEKADCVLPIENQVTVVICRLQCSRLDIAMSFIPFNSHLFGALQSTVSFNV